MAKLGGVHSTKACEVFVRTTTQALIVLAERTAARAWSPNGAAFLTQAEAASLTDGQGLEQALRWPDTHGNYVYPAFQFALGTVDEGVVQATSVFVDVFEAAGFRPPLPLLAAWLVADLELWNDLSPLEALRNGNGVEVAAHVRRWAGELLEQVAHDAAAG